VGEFRCTAKAIYKVTEEGIRVAHWDGTDSPSSSTANLHTTRSSTDDDKKGDTKLHRRVSVAGGLDSAYDTEKAKVKESHTDRLKYILEEPTLRSLFRDFLRTNFCEENLAFWLAVQEFRRRFQTTSSAAAVNMNEHNTAKKGNAKATPGQAAMERHHEQLIQTACEIYNSYLARSSPSELNIDHALRLELAEYLGSVLSGITGKAYNGRLEVEQANAFNATQLQALIKLYERIQAHVFRLMATDSVPKVSGVLVEFSVWWWLIFTVFSPRLQFIKTPKFLSMRRNRDDEWDIFDLATPPGLDEEADDAEEHGGFYVTVSAHATEQRREHRNQQDQQH
jgi:GTPase-activating protein SST2